MGLPKLSKELFKGLLADLRGKDKNEAFLEGMNKIMADPVVKDVFQAIMEGMSVNPAYSELEVELICSGVLMGMVYTYVMYNAQLDANELEEQWGS